MPRADRAEFSAKTKLAAFKRAGECCEECRKPIVAVAEYDHIIPASIGGGNDLDNCRCLCRPCHASKTRIDVPQIAKTKRIVEKRAGLRAKSRPMPGSKRSKFKRRMDGTVVLR